MRRITYLSIVAAALVLLLLVQIPVAETYTPKVKVLTTISSLASIISRIGGEYVEVESLIPPGADPHNYEIPENVLVSKLKDADVVFMTGPSHIPLEEEIYELKKEGLINITIVDYVNYTREGLVLLKNPRTGLENPHGYFLTYSGIIPIARTASSTLIMLEPEHEDYFRCRLSSVMDDVKKEWETLRNRLPSNKSVAIMTPILQYIATDLGFNVKYLVIADVGVEPTQEDFAKLKSLYSRNEISVLLISDKALAQNPKLGKVIEDLGVPYVVIPVARIIDEPFAIPPSAFGTLGTSLTPTKSLMALNTAVLVSGIFIEASIIAGLLFLLYKWRKMVLECKLGGEEHG